MHKQEVFEGGSFAQLQYSESFKQCSKIKKSQNTNIFQKFITITFPIIHYTDISFYKII